MTRAFFSQTLSKFTTLPRIYWFFGLMIACYALPIFFAHAPWKPRDAIFIGLHLNQFQEGYALFPMLTHQVWLSSGPLATWISGLFTLFSDWPSVTLIRLPNLIYLAVFLWLSIKLTKYYPQTNDKLTLPILLLATVGFLLPVHEATPVMLLTMLWMLSFYAIINAGFKPLKSGILSGLSIAAVFLIIGYKPIWLVFVCMPLFVLIRPAINVHPDPSTVPALSTAQKITYLTATLIVALLPVTVWLYAAYTYDRETFYLWQTYQMGRYTFFFPEIRRWLAIFKLIVWASFPLWPLALYTLFNERKRLFHFEYAVPAALFIISFFVMLLMGEIYFENIFLLVLPLAILANMRIQTLSNSVSGLLGWFSALIFSLIILYFWVVYSAMVFGIPEKFSLHLNKIFPDFVHPNHPVMVGLAFVISVAWFFFLWLRDKKTKPLRDLLNWTTGVGVFSAVTILLGLPLLDYLRSYEPVSQTIANAILLDSPNHDASKECLAYHSVGPSQRASFVYFNRLNLRLDANRCRYLLVQDNTGSQFDPGEDWSFLIEAKRPKDKNEIYRLYHKENRFDVRKGL